MGDRGERRLDGKWADGNPIRARATYEPMLGGRFMHAVTFVTDADGRETQRDLVLYAESNGTLTQSTFARDGSLRHVEATKTDDRSLFFEWTKPPAGDSPAVQLRQRITPVSDAEMRIEMFMLIRGDWHRLIDAQWTRSGG